MPLSFAATARAGEMQAPRPVSAKPAVEPLALGAKIAAEKAKREAEAKGRAEAEAAEKAQKEAEEKAKAEAEAKARQEAEEKARKEAEAAAKREAEERAKQEAEEKARLEAEAAEQARKAAEKQARLEAEATAKAKREAEAKAKKEAEEKARRAAEEKTRKEAEEKAKREAEEKARREAEAKARKEAEERARREAEAKAKKEAQERARREAEEKALREAEAKARKEAEEKARREAEGKAKKEAAEKARKEAEEQARKDAEEKARREAEAKARKQAEEKAKREAEEARKAAEEKARKEAEAKAAAATAETKAKKAAEEKARREAEAKAKKQAEEKAKTKAEEKAKREAEQKAKREAEEKAKREAEEKAKADEQARFEEETAKQEADVKKRKPATEPKKRAAKSKAKPQKPREAEPPANLGDTFRRLIRETGPISLAQYMAESNVRYYAGRDPLGEEGDFITAPEISQMFGELIGLWLADLWVRMGSRKRIHYVELGPGRGTLAKDALRTAKRYEFDPEVHFVEASPPLRKVQSEAFPSAHHHHDLSTLPDDAPLLIVANEFFDALPIHQLVRSANGWHERMIGLEEGELAFVAGETPMDDIVPKSWKSATQGTMIETSPAAVTVMTEIAHRLKDQGGAALIIDYGASELRAGSTLQALRAHEKVDVLSTPGEMDLTAHVDFELLQQVAEREGADVMGLQMQGDWLINMGIDVRTEALQAKNPGEKDKIQRQYDRLVQDNQMGALFKVLGVCGRRWPIGVGFE